MKSARSEKAWPTPTPAETAYGLLSSYRFVQRLVGGKSVADIRLGEVGSGPALLAGTAGSVTVIQGASGSMEGELGGASATPEDAVPGVEYAVSGLPGLSYPEDHFDVVLAFGVIEKLAAPEALLSEARRVLKRDRLLILSTPDKQNFSNEDNHRDPAHEREFYMPELREVLESRFGEVRTYRLGAVAGALLFGDSGEDVEEIQNLSVESTRFSATNPPLVNGPPQTHFVLAVCGASGLPADLLAELDDRPHLLLDDERRIYEECEDQREDIRFLEEEIRHLQETEVQAFQDALKFQTSENTYLAAQLEGAESGIRDLKVRQRSRQSRVEHLRDRLGELQQHARDLKKENQKLARRLEEIETSRSWRLLGAYRKLRKRFGA